jgi:hypothetical protein
MHKSLLIEYENTRDTITLEFALRDNPVVERWVERVKTAQASYPIDDPKRFYGFGTEDEQISNALVGINKCIELVNSHKRIINRTLLDIRDQDTLNYLHHIFEVHHGLLDQQTGDYWSTAPSGARRALADLNIWVHRCETAGRGAEPRHVVTWFGLPKDRTLDIADYSYFTDTWQPGTVFLNYVEIGKTIQDLAEDNDQYIAPEAFQPFRHYSADFVVRFFGQDQIQANRKHAIMLAYYQKHRKFFGDWQWCYTNGSLPLADLVTPVDLKVLAEYQSVKSVSFN